MKVLIVSATLDPIHGGGVAERSFQLSQHLAATGNEVTLLTMDLGLTAQRRAQFQAVKLCVLPCLNQRFYIPKTDFKKIGALIKAADIIHLMGHWTLLNVIAYYYIQKNHKKYFFCPAGAYLVYGRSKLIKYLYNKFFGKKILQNAHATIAITSAEAHELKTYGDNLNVCVIPNGINPEDYRVSVPEIAARKYGITKPYILFLGRLNEIKGPDLLLEAFIKIKDQIPDYQLIFAGPDDGMAATLLQKIQAAELSHRVSLIGHVGGELKAALLSKAALLVIPSRSEAMSIVVLEAGIVGTIALVTDRCGVNELAQSGGVKIVAVDSYAIANGLMILLNQSAAELNTQGKNLQQTVMHNYTWQALITKYNELANL